MAAALKMMCPASEEHCVAHSTRKGIWKARDNQGCALVLRKAAFNGTEDVGWQLDKQGALRMIYDVDDAKKLAATFGVDDFSSGLGQYYAAAESKAFLELAGYGCEVSRTSAGEVQVVGTAWAG